MARLKAQSYIGGVQIENITGAQAKADAVKQYANDTFLMQGGDTATGQIILNRSGDPTIAGASLGNSWLLAGTAALGIGMDNNEIYKTGGDLFVGTIGNHAFHLNTNGDTKRMTITGGGNIGINITEPGARLHVNGTAIINATTMIQGGADLRLRAGTGSTDSGDVVFQQGDGIENARVYGGPNQLIFSTGPTPTISMHLTNGKVGIGNFTPNITLALGDTDTGFRWNSDDNMDLMSNNIAALNVNAGNITINRTFKTAGNLSILSGDGRGVKFWDSDSYSVYMSSTEHGTYGGRFGEGTSDYNMYFVMSGGINRGFVFKNTNSTTAGVFGIDSLGNFTSKGNGTVGGFDFRLGSDEQTARGNSGTSRALVKDTSATLVINYDKDFTGGVRVDSAVTVKGNIAANNATFNNGASTEVNIVHTSDTGEAVLNVYGAVQGTGRVYVGQETNHGGGIEYNGDAAPAGAGAGADYFALYRRTSGVTYWTARNLHNSNDWEFVGKVLAQNLESTADLYLTNGGVRSDKPFGFLTIGGGAQQVHAGGLLVSSSYSDASSVPTNGAYIKGSVIVGGNLTLDNPGSATRVASIFAGTTTNQNYIHFNAATGSNDPGYIMHETSTADANDANRGVLHLVPSDDNDNVNDYVTIHGTNDPETIKLYTGGNITTPGSISGGAINGTGLTVQGNATVRDTLSPGVIRLSYGTSKILIGDETDLGTNSFAHSIALSSSATIWPFGITKGGSALFRVDLAGAIYVNGGGTLLGNYLFSGANSHRAFSIRSSNSNWSWFAMGGTGDSAGGSWHVATHGSAQDIGGAGAFHIRGANGSQTSLAIEQNHTVKFRTSAEAGTSLSAPTVSANQVDVTSSSNSSKFRIEFNEAENSLDFTFS